MDSKELALAVAFGKAPKNVQDAAKAAADMQRQIRKMQATLVADQAKLNSLIVQSGELDKALRGALKDWDPDSETTAAVVR